MITDLPWERVVHASSAVFFKHPPVSTSATTLVVLTAVAAVLPGCGGQPQREATRIETTVSGGVINVDSGFEDRYVGTATAAVLLPSGLGVQAEIVGEAREEDAVLAIGGVSYATENFITTVRLGTSTVNEDILPDLFAEGQLTYVSEPEDGYTLTLISTHRRYRNTAEETAVGFVGTKYLPAFDDFLWIAQGFGRLALADPGGNLGYSAGGSLAFSEYNQWAIGTLLEGGNSRYESVIGAVEVENRFFSIRPFASLRLTDNMEIFARLEHYNTEFFNTFGGFAGIKITTDIFHES